MENQKLRHAKVMARGLATKALDISRDAKLDGPRKSAALRPVEDELKHWMNEVSQLEYVDEKVRNLGAASWGNLDPTQQSWVPGGVAPTGSAGRTVFGPGFEGQVGAPPLDLGEPEAHALFDAAVSRRSLAVKAAISSTDVPPAGVPQQTPPVPFSREPTRVATLLPMTATDRPSIDYYVTTGTSAAAAVAEGAPKPTSSMAFVRVNARAVKIAHVAEATMEALEDFPAFAGLLQNEMVQGLIAQENSQLLAGDGVGANMVGLLNTSGTISRVRTTETQLDSLELAATDLRVGARFLEPDGVVMHPRDYSTVRRIKSTQGEYIAGDPLTAGPAQLWGVPVVLTTSMPLGTALVGNFANAAQVYVRDSVRYETNAYGTTNWVNNTLSVRCEERLIMAVVRPAALVKVTNL